VSLGNANIKQCYRCISRSTYIKRKLNSCDTHRLRQDSNNTQLRVNARSLSDDTARTVIQAFISCRLDYCNALLCGISDGLIQHLQSVQNAAARLVTGARRRDHITPVLRQLHWLPVRQRVDFKIAVLVYKSRSHPDVSVGGLSTRHGSGTSAPPVSGRSHLRSASDNTVTARR